MARHGKRTKRRRAMDPLGQQCPAPSTGAESDADINGVDDLEELTACSTPEALRTTLLTRIDLEVRAMSELVEAEDAFDIIELMRLYEFGGGPYSGGSALAVEIVAAVLLSRPSRRSAGAQPSHDNPGRYIEELHGRAERLIMLAGLRHQAAASLSSDPVAAIAAGYQGAVMGIRNLQYASVRQTHEQQLFSDQRVIDLMRKHLGYTYPDVTAVRAAMASLSSQRLQQLGTGTARAFNSTEGVRIDQAGHVSVTDTEQFLEQLLSLAVHPAERATFTADAVAAQAGISTETAAAVLQSYAQHFDASVSAADRVYSMLVGTNPFHTTPLIVDDTGHFVATSTEIGLDSLRRILESALKSNSADFSTYDKKVRKVVSESIAVASLEKILKTAPAHVDFTYYAPIAADQTAVLGRECTKPQHAGKQVEGDGLFVVDDVAVVLETKGKSTSRQSRRGDVRRLTSDLGATVKDACGQARRLQDLIEVNGGIWLGDGSWFDLSYIREVRSVVALLDDVGPLGTAIGELQRAGIVSAARPPWITSLHDLATIATVSDRPAEFLLYLRRRTDSPATTYFWAVDELDLYMLFLQGGLYAEPDEAAAAVNFVDDHCEELNAWMDREPDNPSNQPPAKPSFNALPDLVALIDQIGALRRSGWLRFGADMLHLAVETQQRVLDLIDDQITRGCTGPQYRHSAISLNGMWGHPIVFLAVRPDGVDMEAAKAQLQTSMGELAGAQGADRCYGLLFDLNGNIEHFEYLTRSIAEQA